MKCIVVSNMYPDAQNPSYGVFVKKFCQQLDSLGVDYALSVMYKQSGAVNKLKGYAGFFFSTVWKLLRNDYDCVYVHYASHSSWPVLLAGRLKKLNIITNVHGSDVVPDTRKQEKFQRFTKAILKVSDKVVVPSEYFGDVVARKYGIGESKIRVYPSGGVDPETFRLLPAEQVREYRHSFGIEDDKRILGFVGRLSNGKGWKTYLDAVSRLEDVHVFLVGDGPQGDACSRYIDQLGLKDRVIRLGLQTQEELCKLYNLFDYFIFPTEREGESLGLVALEAMACGAIAVCSDYAAPGYYIHNWENGVKFPMGDAAALAETIRKLNGLGPEELAALKEAGLKTAEQYTPEHTRGQLTEIFTK
ncbi:MAG: glycosyltransferase family 4 protein [Firmicutes bacterium]|nr:glycosyltransferase family 4 protein [Bacillota bacterium]